MNSSLADHFRMVAIDLPGHGDFKRNGAADTLYSIESLVDFVTEFCQKMNFENLVLFGHSLGGHLAIETASNIDNLIGIMVLGTPPLTFSKTTTQPFLEHPAFPLLMQGELEDEQVEQLAHAFWNEKSKRVLPDSIADSIRSTDPIFRNHFGKSVLDGKMKDEVDVLKRLKFPVALAVGEHDALINHDYIREVAVEIIWRNDLQVIPGGGHTAQIENPEAVNQLIIDYVQSLEV